MLRLPLLALALVAGLSAVAACDGSGADLVDVRVEDLSHDPAALVGTWDLITTGSWSLPEPVTTPVEAGAEVLTFRADGTLRIGRAGQPAEETTYRVVPSAFATTAGPTRQAATLWIGEARREPFGIDGPRLYLDARPVDGELREYARR